MSDIHRKEGHELILGRCGFFCSDALKGYSPDVRSLRSAGKGHRISPNCYGIGMRGFTLLEILISIAILVTLMIGIYGVYKANIGAVHRVSQKGQVFQMARIALDRMTKDLESAFVASDLSSEKTRLGMIGKDQEIEGNQADRLDFTTLSHLVLDEREPRTDVCEVGYQLVKDPEGEGFILFRRDDWNLDENLTEGGTSHELARRVTGLNITYQSIDGVEFDNWDTVEGKPGPDLPSLIFIQLTIMDQEGGEELFTLGVHPALAGRQKEE
jgi:type II secretion system protein J